MPSDEDHPFRIIDTFRPFYVGPMPAKKGISVAYELPPEEVESIHAGALWGDSQGNDGNRPRAEVSCA